MTIIERALDSDPPWLKLAFADLAAGVREIPGPANHQSIMQAFIDVGRGDVKAETVAWCAAKMGQWLKVAGFPIPPPSIVLTAASFEAYGVAVGRATLARGDLLVFYREGKGSWKRHVCLFLGEDDNRYRVLGGNQSNAVSIAWIAKSELAAIRRPVAPTVAALRDAGSKAIARNDALEAVGAASAGVSVVATVAKEALSSDVAQVAVEVAVPVANAAAPTLTQVASDTGATLSAWDQVARAAVSVGKLIAEFPLLSLGIVAGVALIWAARTGKLRRLKMHIAGMPLSSELTAAPPQEA